jgi:hypothetical protein
MAKCCIRCCHKYTWMNEKNNCSITPWLRKHSMDFLEIKKVSQMSPMMFEEAERERRRNRDQDSPSRAYSHDLFFFHPWWFFFAASYHFCFNCVICNISTHSQNASEQANERTREIAGVFFSLIGIPLARALTLTTHTLTAAAEVCWFCYAFWLENEIYTKNTKRSEGSDMIKCSLFGGRKRRKKEGERAKISQLH